VGSRTQRLGALEEQGAGRNGSSSGGVGVDVHQGLQVYSVQQQMQAAYHLKDAAATPLAAIAAQLGCKCDGPASLCSRMAKICRALLACCAG
jgi:hypothetical protein